MDVITGASPKVVSIICPVRNMSGRLQMLEKWIDKLTEDPRAEVVVVHDFSEDATGDELKSICEKNDSVIFIQGLYGNPGSARNAGLEICTGNWVSFWDCDDEPNTHEFLALIDKIEKVKPDISFGRFSVFNENSGVVIEASTWNSAKEKNLRVVARNPGIWRVVFSRNLLQGMAFKPLRMAEDQIFISEAIMKAGKVDFFDNLIYSYFIGSDRHLTKNPQALQDLLPAFNQTSQMIGIGPIELAPFLQMMAARQLISGLKFGTLRTRLGLIKSLSRSGLWLRPFFLKAITSFIFTARRGI